MYSFLAVAPYSLLSADLQKNNTRSSWPGLSSLLLGALIYIYRYTYIYIYIYVYLYIYTCVDARIHFCSVVSLSDFWKGFWFKKLEEWMVVAVSQVLDARGLGRSLVHYT